MRTLSRAQRESFESNGFLRIPQALDEETVAAIRGTCLRLRDEDADSVPAAVADDSWRDHFDLPLDEKQAACDRARWEATNFVRSIHSLRTFAVANGRSEDVRLWNERLDDLMTWDENEFTNHGEAQSDHASS